ncbi:hypothetical protein [Kribbella sp. NPDC051620]|uniref:hypothetical protein n=1 Tax=Kribbella sp. NPDC051620 TaxID=3364120 RepID=UPI0037A45928
MGRVIAIAFVSLDGYVTDPDGSGGTPYGGWAIPKLVASHRLTDVSGWSNSTLVDGDVVDAVRSE